MITPSPGLHHVTAICGNPQPNIDFYRGILGLRLVKVTINFDDPGAYHFYYGDGLGSPGTIMTFFSWPGAPRGRLGSGNIAAVGFTIPSDSLDFWQVWLTDKGIHWTKPDQRFDETVLSITDPDGLAIELVAQTEATPRTGWTAGPIPAERAIRGLHGVTLWEEQLDATAAFLQNHLQFAVVRETDGRVRYSPADGPGTFVDVLPSPVSHRGRIAVGSTHHVAWRAATDADQEAAQRFLAEAGTAVTPVQDRQYFHSIYFHEPGGVLFEIATDPPGFTLDEEPSDLGTTLKLPPWFESQRAEIESLLPPIQFPERVMLM